MDSWRNRQDTLIKPWRDYNTLIPVNFAENEVLIGRPHLRGAREVWLNVTANVCASSVRL